MILVLCGILLAAGLTILALRERAWGLAIFMALITLVSLATAYVALGCLGNSCLFEGNSSSRIDRYRVLGDGDA
jgi:hypothetical protein